MFLFDFGMTTILMRKTLAFYTGAEAAANVLQDVGNLGWMLSDHFDLHLLTTVPNQLSENIFKHFTVLDFSTDLAGDGRLNTLSEYRKFNTYLSTTQPDAVTQITRTPVHGTIVGVFATMNNIPFVYRYNGDKFVTYSSTPLWHRPGHFLKNNILGRVPLQLADSSIVFGPVGKRRLTTRGVDEENIHVLPPTFNPERIERESAADLDIPEGRSVALFVGRIHELKGKERLKKIIPRIVDRRNDIHFVIVGSNTESLKVPAEYEDHLTRVGFVDPERVPEYMRAADVFVYPTLADCFPRVLAESILCGTPVIARAVGDIPKLTQNAFETDDEIVDRTVDYEEVPLDDASRFTREALESKHKQFYEQVVGVDHA